ncbi:recombinase family protein [Nocardia alni]|uniref:recombinase family protein n=1 Tax=Nocardia alni TaxID=2815723 RepID=UPI0020B1F9BE|nr:recombinase family protein [Nocardia alni]
MGLNVVGEYVEPGRSATEITKRVEFQRMLDRIRRERDVDYVVVYELARFARNRLDDAIVMADLKKRGVTLISATESIDDSPVGQLMHGILAAFNEYRSRKDGADVAFKMGAKARKGGTLGQAKIGYLNVLLQTEDGRKIRTVDIDRERGPLVLQAWKLYATGDYSLLDIERIMRDRGLRTRRTPKRAPKPVTSKEWARLFRSNYYVGIVTYKGEEIPGRHEAL